MCNELCYCVHALHRWGERLLLGDVRKFFHVSVAKPGALLVKVCKVFYVIHAAKLMAARSACLRFLAVCRWSASFEINSTYIAHMLPADIHTLHSSGFY